MLQLARDISTHFPAVKVLVGVNIRTTVLTTRLGWLWWLLDPLIMMAIYYFLVKGLFGRGGENYHVFVLSGIVSWQFFIRSLTGTIKVISANRQIIRQIAFPLPVLVAIPIVTHFFFAIIGMFIIMLFDLSVVNMATLGIFPLLLIIGMLSYGLGLFLSVLNTSVGDIEKLVSYLLRAGFFLSPILYPATRLLESPSIPESFKYILRLNPMYWIMPAIRSVMLDGRLYNVREFCILFIILLLLVQLGLVWIRANGSRIIKML